MTVFSFAAEKLKDSIIIFMIGGPGSGKDVQSIRLASKYDFSHVAIGELLREEASRSTSKGKAIREILLKGALVPSVRPYDSTSIPGRIHFLLRTF